MIGIDAIVNVAGKVFDRLVPDKAEEAKRELTAMIARGDQEIKEINAQLSAINMEARSSDPWTSRARPSFLYVIYILILSAIPMGFLSAFAPEIAGQIIVGFKDWLNAIPNSLVQLFGVGYLGYTGARTFDKREILRKSEGKK